MLNFQDKVIELVMKLTDFITGHEAPAEVSASLLLKSLGTAPAPKERANEKS